VEVTLVVDGIGSAPFPQPWQQRFAQAGVQWQRFNAPGSLGLLLPVRWRRLHRKLCVIDATLAFCGGINVLDDYYELNHGPQSSPRLDFAVRITGPLVADVEQATEQFWRRVQAGRQLGQGQFQRARETLLRRPRPRPASATVRPGGVPAALLLRDNLRYRGNIERAYRQAIARARSEVLVANAYFLPGAKLRRALVHAAQRGVRVCLLLQGRYEFFMQFHGAKALYGALLDAGVEIYEYQAGFLHAKVAVIDGHWATVGSSNLDPLSLLLAREANVVLDDPVFAQALRTHILDALRDGSQGVNHAALQNRPLWQRVQDRLAYALMRMTLFLSRNRY